MRNKSVVLIVDDDPGILRSHSLTLADDYQVLTAPSGNDALDLLQTRSDVYAVILDIRMPGRDGLDTACAIRGINESVPLIFYTGYPGDYDQVEILRKLRPFGYLVKGENPLILRGVIRNAVAEQQLRYDPHRLADLALHEYGMIGRSQRALEVYRDIERYAPTHLKILIRGESGTGKELVARALHRRSHRASQGFFPYNCDHTNPELLKSILFGTVRGIYTDAQARDGLVTEADGGTIFLDEIGDLHLDSQSVLMRFLSEGEVMTVGSPRVKKVDVRVLTATNKNLEVLVQNGRFRGDLLARIDEATLTLPPLRDRREDIPLLVHHFIQVVSRQLGACDKSLDDSAVEAMIAHDWPGNVRELAHTVRQLFIRCIGTTITLADVQVLLNCPPESIQTEKTYREELQELERIYHIQLLSRFQSIAEIARQKSCDPSNLRRKLKELGIDPGQFDLPAESEDKSD